jgi:GrpB-like predicted nucleotidyltransferase (UPF0157 family)
MTTSRTPLHCFHTTTARPAESIATCWQEDTADPPKGVTGPLIPPENAHPAPDNRVVGPVSVGTVPSNEEITRHHDDPPGADPWVPGREARPSRIEVVEYDERWPADYARVVGVVRGTLGDRLLEIHHVGSTSVVGLPAKPVIDVDLVVADPADEPSYIPDLEAVGFVHTIREPWWHEHRLLKLEDPTTHLHVFGPDSPEVVRHLMFQAWLRDHPDDLAAYAGAKRAAAAEMNARPGGGTGMDYNRHKEPVVHGIYDRMFRAHGMLP